MTDQQKINLLLSFLEDTDHTEVFKSYLESKGINPHDFED